MELFDIFKKQEIENNKESANEINKWDDFCRLDESLKNDPKLKPIYYLKLYGKAQIENTEKIKIKAINKFANEISKNIIEGDKLSLNCIIEYLINKHCIINKGELCKILSDMSLDDLYIISKSSNLFTYKKMQDAVNKLNEDTVKIWINPLLNSIKKLSYEQIYLEVENQKKEEIYALYKRMINNKFEEYVVKDDGKLCQIVYVYDDGLVICIDKDGEQIDLIYNTCTKEYIIEQKKILKEDAEVFFEYRNLIIFKNYISSKVYDAISKKEKYIIESKNVGLIEIVRNEDGLGHTYMVNCEKLVFNGMSNDIYIEFDEEDDERKLKKAELTSVVKMVEELVEMQVKVVDNAIKEIVKICNNWDERDKDGNEITAEYVLKNFSATVLIGLDGDYYRMRGYLHSDKEDEDLLLGEHEIILDISENKVLLDL